MTKTSRQKFHAEKIEIINRLLATIDTVRAADYPASLVESMVLNMSAAKDSGDKLTDKLSAAVRDYVLSLYQTSKEQREMKEFEEYKVLIVEILTALASAVLSLKDETSLSLIDVGICFDIDIVGDRRTGALTIKLVETIEDYVHSL